MAEQEDIKAWIILGPTDRGWDPVFVVIGTRADAKAKAGSMGGIEDMPLDFSIAIKP